MAREMTMRATEVLTNHVYCDRLIFARAIPHWRSGGDFVRSNGSVEAEEDCAEVGFRSFTGVWLELRLDVDDEGRTDCRERTSLGIGSTARIDKRDAETHKNQGSVETLIVPLHVLRVVLRCLPFVHGIEIELGSSFLMGRRYIRRAS